MFVESGLFLWTAVPTYITENSATLASRLLALANCGNLRREPTDAWDFIIYSQLSSSCSAVPDTAPLRRPGYVKNLPGIGGVWHGSLLITLPGVPRGPPVPKRPLFIFSSSIREGQFQPGWAHARMACTFLSDAAGKELMRCVAVWDLMISGAGGEAPIMGAGGHTGPIDCGGNLENRLAVVCFVLALIWTILSPLVSYLAQ